MYIDIDDIDIERLKNDLKEYFEAGAQLDKIAYLGEIDNLEKMNPNEIISIALNNKFDINEYIKYKTK